MIVTGENLWDFYQNVNHRTFTEVLPEHFYRGYQKIDTSLIGMIKEIGEFPLTLSDMNYTKLKMNNLIKHYFCEEQLKKFFKQLEKASKAKQASIYFNTIGEDKGDHKKDHCIRGIGINFVGKKIVNVHIFYRSSELSRKFLADLIFFNEFLFPKLKIPKDIPCFFHFTCGYVHAKQFPNYAIVSCNDKVYDYRSENIFYLTCSESWDDERMYTQVVKNIKEVVNGDIPGFGMIRATNKMFKENMKENGILVSAIDQLIT